MAYEVDLKDVKFQLFDWLDLESILASETLPIGTARTSSSCWARPEDRQEQLDPANEAGRPGGGQAGGWTVTVPAVYQEPYKTWPRAVGSAASTIPSTVGWAAASGEPAVNEFFRVQHFAVPGPALTRGSASWSSTTAPTSCASCTARSSTRGLDGHHVPDRAAGRVRCGRLDTKAEPVGDGRYNIVGREDLHHLRRSRHDRQRDPRGAGALPGAPRAPGACRSSSSRRSASSQTAPWGSQRRRLRRRSSTRWGFTARRPAACCSAPTAAARASCWARRTAACG